MKSQTHLSNTQTIEVPEVPIRLGQLIKYIGIVENGREAKARILRGEVCVNNEVELRRGRQINYGDCIVIDKISYLIKNPKP